MKQQSFKEKLPTLYLVATPIGNLEEMTPRAINILKEVDVIACEDTRNSRKLMYHFSIDTPLISYHDFNEEASSKGIVALLSQGKNVALISDAGYPLISDPGQTLVQEVIDAGFFVVPISGSSAFLNGLVASGLVVQPFLFIGFLEAKEKRLLDQLTKLKQIPYTIVAYLSVHRVEKTLLVLKEVLGDRKICLARELTKLHEEFIRGTITEVIQQLEVLKGEFVLIIEGYKEEQVIDMSILINIINQEIEQGLSVSRAISKVAKEQNVSKNELYNYYQMHR